MPEHPLQIFEKLDPEFFGHMNRESSEVFTDGALPKKVKLLMAMILDAAHGATEGVRALAGAAAAAGATRQEITEAIKVACYVSGVGSAYTAAAGLKGLL